MLRLLRTTFVAALTAAACGAPPPAVAPTPVPAPADTSPAPTPQTPPPLPPIPAVDGPVAIRVVYPPPNHLIESRDSNFILGSVGTGKATLTINGTPVPVQPNGAFLGFLANPPATAPRYDLVAATATDTARQSLPVRVQEPPRPPLALSGPLAVDSTSITPRLPGTPAMLLRGDDRVRVAVRAPANASAWVVWPGGSQWLVASGSDSTTSQWSTDVTARALRDGATLYVMRSPDTLRFALMRPDLVDSMPSRWVRTGDVPVRPDSDRFIYGRPTPGGTYKWFLLPGTLLEATARLTGYTRLRLDSALEIWVADGEIVPVAPGTPAPRRTTLNARVRSAADWVDLVVPIQGGERPAYLVEEGERSLRLTLYGTRANTDIIQYTENDTLVRTVEWKQALDDRAELVARLTQRVYGYLVLWENGSLVLRIRRQPRIETRHPLRGLTIVVDPGHPPAGSTGPTGLYEGDAVFPIGERLRQLLEERGAKVVMTRTTLDPVDLALRPIIARRSGAHAFVSIHLNAYGDGMNPLTARNGSGTYYFRMLSEPLARPVQRALVRHLGLPNLGVYYDNLAVVRQTWMPSVLAEGAFVIIPEQEAALRTPEFRERYARGLADGLEEYFRWLGQQ